jgi:hypothetical protein
MTTTQTVRMFAPAGSGGQIQAPNGTYYVGADGTVTVNAADAASLQALGYQFAVTEHKAYNFPGAPVAASATVTVSSTSLTAGSLTVAAQPDVPRQLQAVVFPGTTPITAGILTFAYTANDGTAQTDALSLVMTSQVAGTAGGTLATTKGVERLSSVVVSGVSGGNSPGVQVGTNGYLAVPVTPRFVDFAVTSEKKVTPSAGTLGLSVPSDDTVPTNIITAGALVSTTTAPDGTHGLSLGYNYTYPG